MSQPSVAQFFNTRKRAAADDISLTKNKIQAPAEVVEQQSDDSLKAGLKTRSGRTIKRIGAANIDELSIKQQKLVQFIKKGNLSPAKKAPTPKKQPKLEENAQATELAKKDNVTNANKEDLKGLVRKELDFNEVKSKISRSAKLQQLKASLNRIQELEQTRKAQEERNKRLKEGGEPASLKKPSVTLKEFKTIELEVLTSPIKSFKTPTKNAPPTPNKNELMSPRRTEVSKRLLFSPSKAGSPSKIITAPAYERFLHLVESSKGKLQLPFKYRNLIETFKCLDSVCAMFYNRKENITFKKLKPAVQRMLRKNFCQSHLAQIKHLYPDAYIFTQVKMRNYGSVSKQDYFQLVIAPNVAPHGPAMKKIDENDVLKSADATAMNPQVMTDRLQKFQSMLLAKVKDEHDKFLQSLDPPLSIPKDKVTRWHPDFDLENVPEIELGHLPQPPNVEKYSSAKDILSTARNLFNCATPMERAMERLEAKQEKDRQTTAAGGKVEEVAAPASTTAANLLKGVPASLMEKIRAKQAAKALDAMTRRPSQDREATKYSRLPELARHLRNVFITERKGVLTMEVVLKKIENSFRTSLTHKEIEQHIQLIAKECPEWVAFHEIRKTMYLKVSRDLDLTAILEKLKNAANEKTK